MADFPITEAPEFSGTMAQITNQDRGRQIHSTHGIRSCWINDNYLKRGLNGQE